MTPQSYATEILLHQGAAALMNSANYPQAPCAQPPNFNNAHLLIQQPNPDENSYHY